jgi:hypothetical protein
MKFSDLNLLSIGNSIGMVGAIYSGEGQTILCYFPGEGHEPPVDTLEMTLDEWQRFLLQTDTLETEVSARAADGTVSKAILRKSQRTIDASVSWRVFKRAGYRCEYCGNDNAPLTVDHLVRWEEGGPSIEANLVAADKRCNKTRGNMSYAQWLESPFYKKVSAALSEEKRAANRRLLETLDAIPRKNYIKSR